MGWGSFFAGLAADAAKDYVNKRGIDGVMEDAGNIASGVKNFFSGPSSSATWDDITSHVCELVESGEYIQALNDFDQYYLEYENGVEDVFYYYWRAQILINYLESSTIDENFEEISKSLNEAIRKGRGFKNSEINDQLKDICDRQREATNFYLSMKEWSDMCDKFNDLLNHGKPQEALNLLENHYSTKEGNNYDYYYYENKYLAIVNLISTENSTSSLYYEKAYLTVKECYDNMKDEENPSDNQNESIESCKNWMNNIFVMMIRSKSDDFLKNNDFQAAENLVNKEFKYSYPPEYRNAMSRIKSLYLLFLIENKESSIQKIEDAIRSAEEALTNATTNDDNEETKRDRLEVVTTRISKGKKYLNTLINHNNLSESTTKSQLKCTSPDDNESEYIEELKACFEDGIITDKERRLLDRLRKSLGISEARAAELEAMCNPQSLSAEEQEYADEVKACLEDDGEITPKERRLLDRLAKSLGISQNRATEIEHIMK